MIVMTSSAHYRASADATFALALDLDALNRDFGGLLDYHGLPSGKTFEGQSYSCSTVVWTWFRLTEFHVTTEMVNSTTRQVISTATQNSGTDTPHTSRHITQITPEADGCRWSDRIEMSGPPVGRIALALSRYLIKASHRRRRARDIRVHITRP